jgi:uncharacterized protein (DUF2267 family)
VNERAFISEVAERAECDPRRAETLTFAVFQELRDRLTPDEAAKVAAQLPASLKMLWLSFDRPDRHVRRVHESQFLYEVARMAALESGADAERAVMAVFPHCRRRLAVLTGQRGRRDT